MGTDREFGRTLLVACDVSGFGSGDDQLQEARQAGLVAVLDEAAAGARLVRSAWDKHDRGDGELALLPATESEPRVVDDFIRQLEVALSRHNRHLRDAARLRLRVAIHFGVAYPADNGYVGQGIVAVSRLLDSEPLRLALRESSADLALILSDGVYQDTVVQGHVAVRPREFRRVAVRNKEFSAIAWVWLPDNAVHDLPRSEQEEAGSSTGGPEGTDASAHSDDATAQSRTVVQPTVRNIFENPVHAPGSTFGVRIDNRTQ